MSGEGVIALGAAGWRESPAAPEVQRPGPGAGAVERSYGLAILAGGEGRRLGGVSKADLVVGGQRLLDAVVAAARALPTPPAGIVVVAPEGVTVPAECLRTLEDPPLGGPAAGVAAAADVAGEQGWERLAVVPCDASRAVECLPTLLANPGRDGALAVAEDRDQNAIALLDVAPLRAACAAGARDTSLRRLLGRLDLARVAVPLELVRDIDTPEDLAQARGPQ